MYEIRIMLKSYRDNYHKIRDTIDLSVKDGFMMLSGIDGTTHSYNRDFIVGYAVREIEENKEEK